MGVMPTIRHPDLDTEQRLEPALIRPLPLRRQTLAASLFVLALAAAGTSAAEQSEAGNGSGSGSPDSGNGASASQQDGEKASEPVTDAQLEKFATAFGDIRKVRAQYQQKLRQASNKEDKAQLKKEGRRSMMAAIQNAGLDVAEYQRIGKRLNQDQALQKRLQKMMQDKRGGASTGAGGEGTDSSEAATQ